MALRWCVWDPLTLRAQFDFDAATRKLVECEAVFATDYFLQLPEQDLCELFKERARMLIFETLCGIHHKVNIRCVWVCLWWWRRRR